MSAPGGIRRNFSNFKGLNQGADDLTRPVEFADEATNVEITRKGSVVKRPGAKSQSVFQANASHGLYSHVFSKNANIISSPYEPRNASQNFVESYDSPTGVIANWNVFAVVRFEIGTAPLYTSYIVFRDFGFDIPSDSQVTGISLKMSLRTSRPGLLKFRPIFAVWDGTVLSGNGLQPDVVKDDIDVFNTSSVAELRYHEPENLYGTNQLTPTLINSANFGMALRLVCLSNITGQTDIEVETFYVSVNYREGTELSQQTKLYSFGNQLQEHSEGSVKIVYSPSGGGTPPPAKLFILPNTATNQYKVDLQVNDTSISGFPKYYNIDTAPNNIAQLHADINATTDFYMETTPAGTMAALSPVPMNPTIYAPGHTFTKGQRLTGYTDNTETVLTSRYILDVQTDYLYLDGVLENIAGRHLGLFNELVASIPEQDGLLLPANDTTAGIIKVPLQIPTSNILSTNLYKIIQGEVIQAPTTIYDETPFVAATSTYGVDDTNTSFVSKNGNLYFGLPFYINSGNVVGAGATERRENGGLWKYDGKDTCLASMPSINVPDVITPEVTYGNAGMTANSTYKFKFQYCYRDYRGNFIEGPLSDEIAMQTSGTALNASFTWYKPTAQKAPFPWRGILANTDSGAYSVSDVDYIVGHALATSGTPSPLIGNVLPGTEVVLYNFGATQWTGSFVTRTIVDTDTDGFQRARFYLDEPVSWTLRHDYLGNFKHHGCVSQIRIRVWRTVADGSLFYFCTDLPAINLPGITGSQYSFYDGTSDSDLGEPLIEPDRRPSLFPTISTLSMHQGLIVASGNPNDPETVYFEDQLALESSPAATSSFRVVGSKSSGPVTAHASDNDDMLAVFKEEHYFNVVGDLDSLSFQVLEVSKGDYGCSAHAAIVKMDNTLLFPSNTGFKAIAGGQLVTEFNDVFVDDFLGNNYSQALGVAISESDQDKFVLRRAVAAYLPETQQYVCFIPCESGTPGPDGDRESNANSRVFVFHRRQQAWTKWQLPAALNMAAGMVWHKGQLYWAALLHETVTTPSSSNNIYGGKVFKQRDANTSRDFLDDVQAIEMRLRMTWDSLDNPSDYFNPVFLKLYQFNDEDFLTAFDLTVKEYRNYNESTVYTQASRAFSTVADKEKRFKFKNGRASSISLEFYNNTAEQKPVLTGYEYEVRNPYLPRIKAGRNR